MVKVGDKVKCLLEGTYYIVEWVGDLGIYAISLKTTTLARCLQHGTYEVVKENLTTEEIGSKREVKVGSFVRSLLNNRRYVVQEVGYSGVKARDVMDNSAIHLGHGSYDVIVFEETEEDIAEAEEVKHNHYFVDLSAYIKDGKCVVDVYKILAAYKVVHPELQHLGKKVLCLGQRGLKDALTDAENILDSAESLVERLKLEIAYANKGE